MQFLSYLFWPNLPTSSYSHPKVLVMLVVCLGLMVGSFFLGLWRTKQQPITKKLSRTWASAAFWIGLVGAFLIVSRVEGIQFFSMRFLWVLWALAIAVYVILQIRIFRSRHYEVLPTERVEDPRGKYLPGKKKK